VKYPCTYSAWNGLSFAVSTTDFNVVRSFRSPDCIFYVAATAGRGFNRFGTPIDVIATRRRKRWNAIVFSADCGRNPNINVTVGRAREKAFGVGKTSARVLAAVRSHVTQRFPRSATSKRRVITIIMIVMIATMTIIFHVVLAFRNIWHSGPVRFGYPPTFHQNRSNHYHNPTTFRRFRSNHV
jgi:hypothetical protein